MTLTEVTRGTESKTDVEVLAPLGLKIEALRGRRVLIFGEDQELIKTFEDANAAIEVPNKKIDFEALDQEGGIGDELKSPLKIEAENGSVDFILDIRAPEDLPESAYAIGSYREMLRVLNHRGRIIIKDPIGKRAFPITGYLDEKYEQYQDNPEIAERTEKLAPVIKKIFAHRNLSDGNAINGSPWWKIIDEMVEEECQGESDEKETICGELVLNLSSRLKKKFDYQVIVGLENRGRPIASSKVRVGQVNKMPLKGLDGEEIPADAQDFLGPQEMALTIEKSSLEVVTTFTAARYIQDSFDIELNISELRILREIVSRLLGDIRKADEYFSTEEGKTLERGDGMAPPYIEAVARFLSSVYKVEIANKNVSLIAKKIDYLFPINGTMITVSKYFSINGRNYFVEEREFDQMKFDSYKEMSKRVSEYRSRPLDREKVEEFSRDHDIDPGEVKTVAESKRSVSRELKEIIQKARESVIG